MAMGTVTTNYSTTLVVLRGNSASGKSSVAAGLREQFGPGQAHDPAPDAAALLGGTAIAFEDHDLGVDRVEAELRGDVPQALHETGEGSGVDTVARVVVAGQDDSAADLAVQPVLPW